VYFARKQKVREVEVVVTGRQQVAVRCYVSTPDSPATFFTQWNTVCVIPARPLEKATAYQVVLRCTVAGKPYSRTWRFTTGK
jgi:hypothetical protein